MIYPNDFEARLGFDRVREQIKNRLSTSSAIDRLNGCSFSTSYDEVLLQLNLTEEMLRIVENENDFPLSGYVDIRSSLTKLRAIGSYPTCEEMLLMRQAMATVGDLVRFFRRDGASVYPNLVALSGTVEIPCNVPELVERIVDKFGKVKDSASMELQEVRSTLRSTEQQVGRRLQQLLKAAQASGLVEEGVSVSIRDGRAVIPVLSANKRKIKGFVHDESATGKTSYIEPIEIVELNNKIKELESKERREVIKVLVAFADALRPYIAELLEAECYLSHIDFIKAKALVAVEMGAVKPILETEPRLYLKDGRHPLLEKTLKAEGKQIVPLNITLDNKKRIVVISGPNAGGKSVCLKCVGLLQYMVQCGILVPSSPNSEFGIFSDIFIDIGDQQSIENDLSTYSSHLNNMKIILRGATRSSLILIDEFGTGTEPTMGGAIAETILEHLERRSAAGVITTHYSNIKFFASKAEGIANAAMSFDIQNIRPLFSLEMGKPGSSFAFEIARKSGLPEEVVKEAIAKVGTDQISMEKQLREIARDKRYWESKRDRIRLAEKRADDLAQKNEELLSEVTSSRNKIIAEAKAQAASILSEANRHIEKTIREIKESQADKERTKNARLELQGFKDSVAEVLSQDSGGGTQKNMAADIEAKMARLRQKQERRKEQRQGSTSGAEASTLVPIPAIPREIVEGSKVRLKGQMVAGEVVSLDGKRAKVAFGHIHTLVEIKKLEAISEGEFARQLKENALSTNPFTGGLQKATTGYDVGQKRLEFSSQIDLRGSRVEEALIRAQEFTDEAIMLGFSQIKILHGKGTGALKSEIRRMLLAMPLVKSVTDEHEQFGGAGITVIDLDV